MKSLLIVGHPKGFTSKTYTVCHQATALRQSGISAGEVLNWQRNQSIASHPFISDGDDAYRDYEQTLLGYKNGFIIKDVVQPHVVLRFIESHPDCFHVLYVHRDPDQVALAHRRDGWSYYPDPHQFEQAFLRFPTVEYERALIDPEAIFSPLRKMGYAVEPVDYITETFREKSRQTRDALDRVRVELQSKL